MNLSSRVWIWQSQRKSFKSLGAGNHANTRNTVSWENRILQTSNRSITYFPSGPSRARPRLRLRSWSTQAPLWWQNLEESSASFSDSHSSLFGTSSLPWEDFATPTFLNFLFAFKKRLIYDEKINHWYWYSFMNDFSTSVIVYVLHNGMIDMG